ncbi:MAG: DUF1735 domain-containing protein [Bacteroidota bacterium]
MKKIIKGFMISALVSFSLASCLKAVNTNVNGENLTTNFLQLEYVKDSGQTNINSGLQYFAGSTLLFPPDDAVDTINFQVTYNGPTAAPSDITVTLAADWTAINDNFGNDGITYEKMPDSLYKVVTPTVTVKAGTRVAYAKIAVYPSKIDPTKSYMAPIAPSATGVVNSGNFGHIYFHTIGNPMAGAYTWDFYRYNALTNPTFPTGYNGGSFFGATIAWLPVNPTNIHVPTGYYVQPNYLITFKNTGGVLSNFKAVIDPGELPGAFTANGISMIQQPVITVTPDYKKVTINYVVFNGASYRNCTDIYTKQ